VKFRRQERLGRYIPDFLAMKERLIVELDGGQHANEEELRRDLQRTRQLKKKGFRVLRFWNGDVLQDVGAVLLEIQRAISASPRRRVRERDPSPQPSPRARGEGAEH